MPAETIDLDRLPVACKEPRACAAWNNSSPEAAIRLWEQSSARQNAAALIVALDLSQPVPDKPAPDRWLN